ncbi:MAG: hypothetical protein PVI50_02410 [Gammaproteobacteria bacterium]
MAVHFLFIYELFVSRHSSADSSLADVGQYLEEQRKLITATGHYFERLFARRQARQPGTSDR